MGIRETDRWLSWGRVPRIFPKEVVAPTRLETDFLSDEHSNLAFGLGRSYGDVCLNAGGRVLSTQRLDNFVEFDQEKGVLRVESGVGLSEVLDFAVRRGWFLPVSPGTKFVTVGGAVANDIHGKNHHRSGTFGRHVRSFELLRSNGERILCSPNENTDLFRATIGGLGLTGLLLWVEFQLKPISGPFIDMESIQFSCLEEFFEISQGSEVNWEYTVAWLDCVSRGANFGRGVFMRGNHSGRQGEWYEESVRKPRLNAPIYAPNWALNSLSVKAFNCLYYHKQLTKIKRTEVHYEPFFYPLDSVNNWHRIYGTRGFFQFQCALPPSKNYEALETILRIVVDSGKASFLAVLKEFGAIESPGMLSFPLEGPTISLDLPNDGAVTRALLRKLEKITLEAGGRIYPAKDAAMSAEGFRASYPELSKFTEFIDPNFSSSFWRRVSAQ